ncbi:hypothetical protein K402DRAFT_320588 [Aulographum hederae CBS 113979]|uniref:Maintenance of telomere capping protein 6 n=1 Tax=Aulographum hederae CBS 113979 TaxID=1176131 RepID=A0A6G1HGN2_9PEZI|nr:hypothetical protein K402DRAFT_320588 [Aulographum hederae CBS 113979]
MSDQYYDPDPEALLAQPWNTTFLSQRDLGLVIPINYVTSPGVSLTAACFGNNRYDEDEALKCFSNLLALGFKRLVVDLYWDHGRNIWSFCPVQVPTSPDEVPELTSQPEVTTSARPSVSSVNNAGAVTARSAVQLDELFAVAAAGLGAHLTVSDDAVENWRRQVTPAVTFSTPSIQPTSSASTSPLFQPPPGDGQAYQLSPYQCTPGINFPVLTRTISSYFTNTSNTLEASITYLVFNLHLAAPFDDPTGVASTPPQSELPATGNLLSDIVATNLSSYLYTPTQLDNDRTNLNSTWFRANSNRQPDLNYEAIVVDSTGIHATPDGWPSESYIEFQQGVRLLAAYGQVDSAMQGYNFSGDMNNFFSFQYINNPREVEYAESGRLTQGCFFDSSTQTLTYANNNSWAYSDELHIEVSGGNLTTSTFHATGNLTSCGLSLYLNQTLGNVTANENITLYKDIAYSSIWSWARGQPLLPSQATDVNDGTLYRCAVLDTTLGGRWRVENCGESHPAACRTMNDPYGWAVTDDSGTYGDGQDNCPGNTTFAVPRTGLENTYLLNAINNRTSPSSTEGDTAFWINYNSLDAEACWVSGVNATCPYTERSDTDQTKTVVVPTVAAVIIFVLALLTFFVKCAANRQNSRRRSRRKMDDGWDYEGVPS